MISSIVECIWNFQILLTHAYAVSLLLTYSYSWLGVLYNKYNINIINMFYIIKKEAEMRLTIYFNTIAVWASCLTLCRENYKAFWNDLVTVLSWKYLPFAILSVYIWLQCSCFQLVFLCNDSECQCVLFSCGRIFDQAYCTLIVNKQCQYSFFYT